MLDILIQKDIELLIFLNNLGTTQWDGFWLFITNKFSAIPLYLLLLYFSYKYYGFKKTMVVLVFVALLITVTDQTSNLFKYGFKRLRPCHDDTIAHLVRLVKATCGGRFSYFSAHAANSMAIAIFFGMLFKKQLKYLLPILIFWSLLVSYSRIYIGVHFPLDVLTGIFIGGFYGFLCCFLLKQVFKKYFETISDK
ncbi:phosphatase PAP2 family protein [Lutibacter sp. HS1-25]|uniref:phosphatase PAP2 family protein n=1 Tax=Lutibacter sp. HS1-25 TaxID=2485000 RepID=UPI0010110DD5|nr:phosphatase PAP2 family protein [Lutibacter sp. HS1-25]RXP47066.1 phosphatase PAP2 family protein [Lutibacter sp. HS1-25]